MNAIEYARSLNQEWQKFKRGLISREQYGINAKDLFEQFLTTKHLENGDLDIFREIIREAKNKYAKAKDDYYLKRIEITEYIHRRGLRKGAGVGWYDYRLVQLGLAKELLPVKHREDFSWKSLKIERRIFPDRLRSPDNLTDCPPENELAATQTMYVFLELIDFYNHNYVPTFPRKLKLRDHAWIELPGEEESFDKPYLNIVVTPAERRQFERWRNGIV